MLKILKFLNVFALVCVYQILQGQTVQPYALTRPYVCNGASSADNSFTLKIINSGGNPANWSNPLFTTNWDLRLNSRFGSIVRSGSFQGQVASLTIAGLTYNSGDRFYIVAAGGGTNTAPSTDDFFDVTPKFAPTQPTITATALTICATGTVDLTAVGGGNTYTWSNAMTGTTITVGGGTYTVNESNVCGPSPESEPVKIVQNTVPAKPIVNASGSLILCDGAGVTFSTLPATVGGVIHWSTGATGNSLTVFAADSYFAYEVNSCGTGPNSSSLTVTTANTPPIAPTVTPAGPLLTCNSVPVTLSSTGSATITWFLNGSSTGYTGATNSVTTAGNYTTKESNLCGSSAASNIVVVSAGTIPIAPTVTPSGSKTICTGSSIDLTSSGSNITWSTGALGNTLPVSLAGTYYAYAKNSCGSSLNSNSVVVSLNPLPTASIAGTTTICQNSASPLITFSGAGGTAPYTFTYKINGGANQTATTTSGNSVTVTALTGTPGTFIYSLVSVQESSGTACSNTASGSATITVNPLPTASISGTTTVCQNSSSPLITFSGEGGTAPYTFIYKINGGANQTATTTSGNSVTVTALTGTPGTFIYTLVSVQESSGIVCSNTASGSVTITVNPLPTASIAGTTAVCQNSASPLITFSGVGGTAPYTFTYKINGGLSQTVTTTSGSSVTVTALTGTPGTFIYSLVSVQESSGIACSNTASGSATITVNPLPTASLSGTTTVCENSTSPLITFSGSGGTAPYTFTYKINGGANQTVTTTSGSSVTVAALTGTPGTFIYTLVSVQESSGVACSNAASGSATITVNPLPTASISGTTTVCQNSTSPLITFSGVGGTAPYTFTYKINGGANQTVTTTSGNSISVTALTGTPGTFIYTLVSIQESSGITCSNTASGSATITVNPLPTASIAGTTTVCQNSASPLITFSGAGGTAPYTFTYKINGGLSQTATTTSGNSVTVTALTGTPGTFIYSLVSVQESSGVACSNSASGSTTITVNPLPTASISGTTTVCQNSASPLITFSGVGGTAPYTFTYKINGGANQTVTTTSGSSVTVTALTGTPGTFIYSLVSVQESSGVACSNSASGSATITVNPLPTASIAGSTTVCQNSTSPLITFSGVGGMAPYTFTYRINGGANQTVTTTSGNSVTVSVPTSTPNTFLYSLISVQESSGVACSNTASGSATITVNLLPTASIAGSTTICENSTSPLITFSGSGGIAPYTFTYKINGGLSQTVTTTSGNSVTVTALTSTPGTFIYSLVSVQESSGIACSNSASGSATITVNPLPTASIAGSTTVCQNSISPLITFSGVGGTAPYTFTYRINGGANQTVTSTSGNSATVSVPTSTPNTFLYSLVSVQESSGVACSNSASASALITVNLLPTASISGSTTICQNSASPLITFSGVGGISPYTFTYRINGGTNQTVTTTNGNSATLSLPTSTPGTFIYSLVSVQESSGVACSNSSSATATITVNPLPTASIAGSTTICQNSTAPLITFSAVGGTAPYTFFYKINNGSVLSIITSAGNSVTVTFPTSTPGTFIYSLVSVQESSGIACSNSASGSATVTVNSLPTAGITGSTTVCQNSTAPLITFSGVGGMAPYTFTYRMNGGTNQTVTTISGNSVSLSAQTGTPGTFIYSLVSVQESSGIACISSASGSATITVNPLPTASIAGSTTICQNSASPLITFSGAGGTAPYTFTYKINGGLSQTVITTSGNSASVSVPTSTPGTFIYSLVSVQESSGTACSNLASGSATITVNPLPIASIAGSTTICQNSTAPLITFSAVGGTAPYTFFYKINNGSLQSIVTSSGNSITVNVATSTPGTFIYSLVSVEESSGLTCSNAASATATITVNPLPFASISGSTTICENSTSPLITFSAVGGTAPYTFFYKINNVSLQSIVTSSGNSVTVSVPTGTPGSFIYSMTSVQESSGVACSNRASAGVLITVNPLPTASIDGSTTICQNSTAPLITFSGVGGTAPYTFSYKINGGASQTVTTISGNSVSLSAQTGTPGTFIYSLVSVQESSGTACSNAASGSATITVNPLPTASISGTTTVCQNSTAPLITFSAVGGTAPYTFTYKINGGANKTATTTSGNSVSLSALTGSPGTFIYSLVSVQESSGTACSNAASATATITVNPLPFASIAGSTTICQNSTAPLITFSAVGGTAPYTFFYKINNASLQSIVTSSGNSVTLSVPTGTPGSFIYSLASVQESSGVACSNRATAGVLITVNPLPTASIAGSTTICQNSTAPLITFSGVGGTAPYTFTYKINEGASQTLTTSSGNSVTFSALTGTPGTFIYSLVGVQESSGVACSNAASATATITVNPLPTASIAGSTTICQNSTSPMITFSAVGGMAPYTFFYKINNGPLQSIVTSSGNSVTVTVPTSTPGTFIYSLVSVQESSGLTCSNTASASATVTVKQLATAGISGGTTLCQNDAQPRVTFSATGGVRPYTFVYQINGGAIQTLSTTTDNNISVSVPTTTPGAYSYSLISVQESSSISCLNLSTGTILVTVNPLPTASITGTIKVCQNAVSPFVTFTGSGATAPYTFTYKINGGPARTVNSIKGNSVSIAAPTNIPGVYKYSLIGVQESSSTTCSNSVTDSATVTVNELATASISGIMTVCQKDTSPKVTFTAAGGTGPYVFTYNINGGTPVSVVTSSGLLSVSVDAPTNIVGKFTYNLLSIKESSVTACLNAATGSITITVNELATASIAGTDTVCQNDAARLITFSGKSGVAPYTFTYKINGGVSKTVKSNNGNTATIIAPTNIAGTFIYSLISVQESSGLMCINTVFDSATITVNPQPKTALIETPLAHLCNGVFTQLKVKNYDSSYTYTWHLDGDKIKDVKTDTVMVAKSGTYTVLATSDKGCKAANISNPLKITTGSISKPIITGVLQVCTDGKSKLIAIPTDSTLRYTGFVWTEELRTSTLSTDSFYSAAKGQFKVTVEREKCYDTAMASIIESDTLFPKGELKITPLSLKYGEQANILAEVKNASKYRWDFGDGNKTANATNKMLHNYFVSGDSIPIQVWAISERNCITKFVQKIKVARRDSVTVPDFSFTGNVKDWNIFPSPFKDHLKVSVILQKAETVKIDMFTPDGSWLRTWSFSGAAGENLFSFDKLYTLPGAVTYLFVGWYNGEKHYAQVTKL